MTDHDPLFWLAIWFSTWGLVAHAFAVFVLLCWFLERRQARAEKLKYTCELCGGGGAYEKTCTTTDRAGKFRCVCTGCLASRLDGDYSAWAARMKAGAVI